MEMVIYLSVIPACCGSGTDVSVLIVVVEFGETVPSPVGEFCSSLVVCGSKVTETALEDAALKKTVDIVHKKQMV